MNQKRIGSFISQCRKKREWTQNQLGEMLGVTDKAVSKWETGRSMPDLALLEPLCKLLNITLNELMAGEFIGNEKLQEKSDEVLLEVLSAWLGKDKTASQEETDADQQILVLNDVGKTYPDGPNDFAALDSITFQVAKGSIAGIMGASGSGKTTLLNMISSIDTPTTGTILVDGREICKLSENEQAAFRSKELGFIFQEYNLLEQLTIYENIALALTINDTEKNEIPALISSVAETLGITHILNKFPQDVSGGQRQRCACARAIVTSPSLILADEPTGALDSSVTKQLLETLQLLRSNYNATILMVTHDALSASYCDKILFLQNGKIQSVLHRGEDTKQLYFTRILEKIGQIERGE